MVDFRISPNYGPEKQETGQIDDLIDVFEDRMRGWILEPARILGCVDSRFALPSVLIQSVYFESIAAYLKGDDSGARVKGKTRSAEFFQYGVIDVLKRDDIPLEAVKTLAAFLYREVRCRLFHEGVAGTGFFTKVGMGAAFVLEFPMKPDGTFDSSKPCNSVVVDPGELWVAIEKHLSRYLVRLRDPDENELRTSFERTYRRLVAMDEPPMTVSWHPDTLPRS
ncbi:MAG: hypothetical protein AB7G12_01485 [Thermoanaerobaculia bacterium]